MVPTMVHYSISGRPVSTRRTPTTESTIFVLRFGKQITVSFGTDLHGDGARARARARAGAGADDDIQKLIPCCGACVCNVIFLMLTIPNQWQSVLGSTTVGTILAILLKWATTSFPT